MITTQGQTIQWSKENDKRINNIIATGKTRKGQTIIILFVLLLFSFGLYIVCPFVVLPLVIILFVLLSLSFGLYIVCPFVVFLYNGQRKTIKRQTI
jgi:hypothetical protein